MLDLFFLFLQLYIFCCQFFFKLLSTNERNVEIIFEGHLLFDLFHFKVDFLLFLVYGCDASFELALFLCFFVKAFQFFVVSLFKCCVLLHVDLMSIFAKISQYRFFSYYF